MKKTLVALTVAAFAASSASAVTVYNNEGTEVNFDGSLRLLLSHNKANSERTAHSNLKNDGSRFGVRVKHNISEDFYALGRLELRFNGGGNNNGADFGSLYAHRAYVGLGSKQYGEVTFGRQVTIGDDISRAGFDNTYGVTKTPLTTSGNSVVRYDYKGIEGLQVGVNYNFADNRDASGEVTTGQRKSGYGAGAIYEFKIDENQSASVAAGYSHESYATGTSNKHRNDAWMGGASYTVYDLTLAGDVFGWNERNVDATRERGLGFNVGAKYQFVPEAAVYGNYAYWTERTKDEGVTTAKTNNHRFMLGTEYKFHKQVLAFVEGSYERSKPEGGERTTDRNIGVGLRVFW